MIVLELLRSIARAFDAAVKRAAGAVAHRARAAFRALVAAVALILELAAGPARRLGRAARLRWRRMSAPTFFVASFACLILLGALGFVALPGLYTGAHLGFLDALFTSTSAVCVTGLIVVDTATRFTFWGQLWILVLFQLGGIGLITLTTAIIGAMGRKLSLRTEMTSVTELSRDGGYEIWELALRVARFTIIVELTAAAALFALWVPKFPTARALWHAVFQSVSAFCNAGFSTFSDSLEGFNDSPASLIIISALIVIGGIGFITVGELGRRWSSEGNRDRRRLTSHSWAVLVTTAALLVVGTIGYAALEWNGSLRGLAPHDRLVNAWFMSATARTAGFNSISYSDVGNSAGLLTILLMFVGGSPGSTAGGLKTTTLAVLVAWAWSRGRGQRFVSIRRRAIPESTLENTVSITMLYLLVATASFFVLSVAQGGGGGADEHRQFLPMAFECISAFSTVGLSMGTTARLATAGKLVIIALMFIGRVGLLAFFSAILLRRRSAAVFHPAREDLIVG